MDVWNLCGIALLSAFCAMIVKESGGKLSVFIGIISGIALISLSASGILKIFSFLSDFSYKENIEPYLMTILKILSLGYAVSITAELCREMGENGIASKLELVGRVEMLLLCIPYISKILELAISIV